ncbi:IclR family transcriptional regulator [Otariodibacter oris]|uniref:IclR family transcriptional regulator n=1 Tax=Otariodibacter oris TaxID=1032623 RepID=A0A420XGB2_9PAST|nr:IclR family transcriptional regulator [Otariodibacter oris]QGM80026.1 transcriptional regulator [Otariodibacter oris]RKR71850.1 IclR family transcriptional regulator [Otariodibacter oris]
MAEGKHSGNQSLIRGLQLLDILSNFPNGCPLSKLTELSSLNKSTVHRLLQGLQSEGFIKPTNSMGSYRLTTKCLSLGQKTLSSMNIIHIASPHLETLNLILGETINFSRREGDHSIMIYKLEPTNGMMKTRAYIGQHMELYCSAMGKLFLAHETDKRYLDEYWVEKKAIIKPLTNNTITTVENMKIELADVIRTGFAMDREENEMGVVCIACPIFDLNNSVNYAISVSTSIHRLNQIGKTTILTELRKTSQAISEELGWQPDEKMVG